MWGERERERVCARAPVGIASVVELSVISRDPQKERKRWMREKERKGQQVRSRGLSDSKKKGVQARRLVIFFFFYFFFQRKKWMF